MNVADHEGEKLTPREMVRAHAYPVLGAISTIALVVIAGAMIPVAKQAHNFNACVKEIERGFPRAQASRELTLELRVALCNGRGGFEGKPLAMPRNGEMRVPFERLRQEALN